MDSIGSDTELTEQISELEDRVAQLEGGTSLRNRGNNLMRAVMPPAAGKHFRNAGREQLLGIRAMVDHWIARIDRMDDSADLPEREKIEIS
jgi:hypothetical protein